MGNKQLRLKKRIRKFRNNGFSLVSVLLMALLAMSWLAASSMILLPLFRYVGNSASVTRLEIAAESASDYALALLNDPFSRSTVDPEMNNTTSQAILIPPSVVNQLLPGGKLEVSIISQTPPVANYDASTPNYYGIGAQGASNISGSTLPWRVIESTASLGLLKRRIYVALRPAIVSPALNQMNLGSTSFFSTAGFSGVDMIWLGSNSATSALDKNGNTITGDLDNNSHNIAGDVATWIQRLLTATLNRWALQVLSSGSSKGKGIGNPSARVNQSLQLSSNSVLSEQSGFADPLQPNTNVLNDGKATDPELQAALPDDVLVGANSPVSQAIPPAFSAPKLAIVPDQAFSSTYPIAGLDYSVQSLNLSQGVTTPTAFTATQPTARIFVEGNSTDAVQINGNLNKGGSPENLQIWYNGSET
ncbi:MAG: hypothetical protein IPJ49_02435 [Candidatus Obscuribacter sp.]|nr:hypothetical protein [Candidatus Obscuribacter sp.]